MNLNSTTKIDDQEKGVKRIADLASIGSHGERSHHRGDDDTETIGYYMQSHGRTKHVEIFDIWRCIKVKFTVLHTRFNQDQSIRITGNIPELGNWNKINPIQMTASPIHYREKNEESLIPYETTILMEQPDMDGIANLNFTYCYSLWGSERGDVEWERDPPRKMEIMKSETYRGEQGVNGKH